jgi:two-component system, OmpR family, sensor kinase
MVVSECKASGPGLAMLTPRLREVAALVARGYTNAQVAQELVVSPGTAANHVRSALGKLGLSSRAELAVWASQHGLAVLQDRLLTTLERLLEIDPADLDSSLDQAAQALAEVLGADKVDAFLHESTTSTLVARGTSDTPMGRLQQSLGLDRLPIANGGRTVEVFITGTPRLSQRVDDDREELRGIRKGLGVRSQILVPLIVANQRRGVLLASSAKPQLFTERDLRFLGTVATWVGVVAHRAELANQAATQATEQGRRMAADELITILAHDLRNHLTPLAARAHLVRRRAEREGHPLYLRDAQQLEHSLERLDRLIGELLDTARLEQGIFSLNLQPVDLVALVRETTTAVAPAEGLVDVRADDEEIPVWADPARVRQVLENLAANAFKYQPPQVPIVVEVGRKDSADGPRATVAVCDQGPGVPPEMVPRLFERFAAGSESSGLGLGLYLARRIAEAHAGTLTVDSRPGFGARFLLSLPTDAAPPS